MGDGRWETRRLGNNKTGSCSTRARVGVYRYKSTATRIQFYKHLSSHSVTECGWCSSASTVPALSQWGTAVRTKDHKQVGPREPWLIPTTTPRAKTKARRTSTARATTHPEVFVTRLLHLSRCRRTLLPLSLFILTLIFYSPHASSLRALGCQSRHVLTCWLIQAKAHTTGHHHRSRLSSLPAFSTLGDTVCTSLSHPPLFSLLNDTPRFAVLTSPARAAHPTSSRPG